MLVIGDVPVFGDPVDPEALTQIQRCRATADAAALMADHHIGYAVPIGGVVVYKDAISPSGVGYDIGCGNKAVLTDMPGSEARDKIATLMDDIFDRLSFGMGQKNKRRAESDVFERDEWRLPAAGKLKALAHDQLGTIGSGNHYVDLFTDEQVRILGARERDEVHNHHNFAWLEEHHGEMVWVVRKGATPAFPGQRGFVGGSMGDDAVIVEGVESDLLLDRPRRGPGDEPDRGEGERGPEDGRCPAPGARLNRDDARLGARPRRGASRRRNGRGTAVLQAPSRGPGAS